MPTRNLLLILWFHGVLGVRTSAHPYPRATHRQAARQTGWRFHNFQFAIFNLQYDIQMSPTALSIMDFPPSLPDDHVVDGNKTSFSMRAQETWWIVLSDP